MAAAGAGLLLTFAALTPAQALDKQVPKRQANVPLEMFRNPAEALRRGARDYHGGHKARSVRALKYAADGGEPLARWKLGQMYAEGEVVKKSDIRAYRWFVRIIKDYKEDQLSPRQMPVVANAFVAIGVYRLNGIPGTRVKKDTSEALRLFHYAATSFRNADAQYYLGRMYLTGTAGKKNPRWAARWLRFAADKMHILATAELGKLLFNGYPKKLAPQRALGLMYLTLARDQANSNPRKFSRIVKLYEDAISRASDYDKEAAHLELRHYLRRKSRVGRLN